MLGLLDRCLKNFLRKFARETGLAHAPPVFGALKEDHEVHAGDDAPGPTVFLLKDRP